MNPKPSQLEYIKTALLAGKTVDSVTAFECYYITRLSSIIKRLRDKGFQIVTTQDHNNGLAHYSLAERKQS
jgi:hypothetical protein